MSAAWEPDIIGAITAFNQTTVRPGLTVWADMDRANRQSFVDALTNASQSALWVSENVGDREQAALNLIEALEELGFLKRWPNGAIATGIGCVLEIIEQHNLIPSDWWTGDADFDWAAWRSSQGLEPEAD